jgi:drug/metabolite transporter (DMT)-like permease
VSGIAIGLGLAVAASLALNGSYVIQHVGSAAAPPIDARRPFATLWSLLRTPAWAAGAVLGTAGWAMHVGALTRAPLSLVQAFVAGGLALMAPVASRVLNRPLTGMEWAGVAVVVVSLGLLCVGLGDPGVHGSVQVAPMCAFLAVCGVAASLLARAPGAWRPRALGLAGGFLYGAADVAIKGLTGVAHSHGVVAVLSSAWLPAAVAATAAAFFAFQRGLQIGSPVPVISLMTAATTAVSVAGGFLVFGDPLGSTPALVALHLLAFVLVAVAAAALAPAAAATSAEDEGAGGGVEPAVGEPPPDVEREPVALRRQSGVEHVEQRARRRAAP